MIFIKKFNACSCDSDGNDADFNAREAIDHGLSKVIGKGKSRVAVKKRRDSDSPLSKSAIHIGAGHGSENLEVFLGNLIFVDDRCLAFHIGLAKSNVNMKIRIRIGKDTRGKSRKECAENNLFHPKFSFFTKLLLW